MTFEKQYCFIAICDSCGPACWDTDIAPHFDSAQQARMLLVDQYEWRIERELTGRFRMVCGRCADREDCKRYGHHWAAPELDHGSEQQARWDAAHPGEPLEMCGRCGTVRRDRELATAPANDPDAMVRELPDEQEEILAWLAADTWPEEADTSADALNSAPIDGYIFTEEQQS